MGNLIGKSELKDSLMKITESGRYILHPISAKSKMKYLIEISNTEDVDLDLNNLVLDGSQEFVGCKVYRKEDIIVLRDGDKVDACIKITNCKNVTIRNGVIVNGYNRININNSSQITIEDIKISAFHFEGLTILMENSDKIGIGKVEYLKENSDFITYIHNHPCLIDNISAHS